MQLWRGRSTEKNILLRANEEKSAQALKEDLKTTLSTMYVHCMFVQDSLNRIL